jgi:hypothetical protein
MSLQSLAGRSIAALAGCALLALTLSPAEAFTISGPSPGQSISSAQVDQVYWRHRGGWGWGPGLLFGGLVGGALAGSYYGPRYYGPAYYDEPGYYGYDSCWRRVGGPYGWHWRRMC